MPDRFGAYAGYALRPPEPSDVDDLLSFKNDPTIADLLVGSGRTYTRDDLAAWIRAHRDAPDEAFFVIVDASDRVIGHVALYQVDRIAGTAEFGILIGDRRLWGQGIGTFYTRFMIEHGFMTVGLRRIFLEVLETNPRARAVYEHLGFVVEGRLRQHRSKGGRFVDVFVMGLLREEYRRAGSEGSAVGSAS
jgi:RimJ/RimL family protein N-acetyltransferase